MNVELYRRVLEYIEAHPEEWNQESYCGTSCCFAGHTIALSGHEEIRRDDGGGWIWRHHFRNDLSRTARYVAEDLLKLPAEEADWLFGCDRTLDDFRLVLLVHGRVLP